MNELVLSLFPGIGLLDMAFEEAGFCVVRGPDLLWGGDVKKFHPPAGRFDGVIGGPPCQLFSSFQNLNKAQSRCEAVNLIPEFERIIIEASPSWFLMENVRFAPLPFVEGYATKDLLLNNRWVGAEQNRVRRFTFGVFGKSPVDLWRWLELAALESIETSPAVLRRPSKKRTFTHKDSGQVVTRDSARRATNADVQKALKLQGLPPDFFYKKIYTVEGQHHVLGNGVPLPMGRAIAKAVREALASLELKRAS